MVSHSASIVIPTKNERGNVQTIFESIPKLGETTEVIFVDDSSDGTTQEIQRLIQNYEERTKIEFRLCYQQKGENKAGAIKQGFNEASGAIIMILDGDATVPPKELRKFYDVLQEEEIQFLNGSRFRKSMQNKAMKPLNYYGNRFFAWLLSFLLGESFSDTLCGTKAIQKDSYELIRQNWKSYYDLDPFGDFFLLIGAVSNDLEIKEIPVPYRERKYGESEINRFADGFFLLAIVCVASVDFIWIK